MILTYHEIVPKEQSYLYAVTSAALERHLQLVAKLNAVPGREGRSPLFTFDDGHVSNFRFAHPLLTKYGVHGIFFAIGSFMNNRPGYMTWAQLNDLVAQGHEVQSHGWSHVPLTHCTGNRLDEELGRSKRTLEDRLGRSVDAISAPHGRWNRSILEACAKAGYRRVFTSDPWIRTQELEGVTLAGRLVISSSLSDESLNRLLRDDIRAFLSLRLRHLARNMIKKTLGHRLYHQLWCRLSGWKGPVDMEADGPNSNAV